MGGSLEIQGMRLLATDVVIGSLAGFVTVLDAIELGDGERQG